MRKKLFSIALVMTLFSGTVLPTMACTPTLNPPKMSDDYYKALDSAYDAGKKVGESAIISTPDKTEEVSPDEVTTTDETEKIDESAGYNSSYMNERFKSYINYYGDYYKKWIGYFRR